MDVRTAGARGGGEGLSREKCGNTSRALIVTFHEKGMGMGSKKTERARQPSVRKTWSVDDRAHSHINKQHHSERTLTKPPSKHSRYFPSLIAPQSGKRCRYRSITPRGNTYLSKARCLCECCHAAGCAGNTIRRSLPFFTDCDTISNYFGCLLNRPRERCRSIEESLQYFAMEAPHNQRRFDDKFKESHTAVAKESHTAVGAERANAKNSSHKINIIIHSNNNSYTTMNLQSITQQVRLRNTDLHARDACESAPERPVAPSCRSPSRPSSAAGQTC